MNRNSEHRETKGYLFALLIIFAGLFAVTMYGCEGSQYNRKIIELESKVAELERKLLLHDARIARIERVVSQLEQSESE